VHLPEWYGQLALHGIAGPAGLTWQVAGIAILHFLWPLALLYVALKIPYWIILRLYQPDVILWLEAAAVVVFFTGVLKIALAWQVYWQTH
jgi:hypothetical protein